MSSNTFRKNYNCISFTISHTLKNGKGGDRQNWLVFKLPIKKRKSGTQCK